MRASARTCLLVCLAALASACSDYDHGTVTLEALDLEAYSSFVQPYVGVCCASLDCHGDGGREPLMLDGFKRFVERAAGQQPQSW